jgi:branched-chain amino acid transport system substrate-binding protein
VRFSRSTPPSRRPARRALAALSLALAALATLAALAGVAACAPASDGVLIAAAGNWDEEYGAMNKRGIDLAVEQINSEGGVLGRPLRVAMRNDRGDGARAVSIAAEFLANPEIVAVVGHVNSGTMVAAARVYDEGLPAVSTTASSPDLTGISRWVFRVISSDSVNGLDLARFAGTQRFQRAAILYENNAYGRGLAESFERNFRGAVVASDPIPSERDGNFEPFVSYLASRSPDVVFVAGTEASGLAILREARRQHLSMAFLGSDGWTGVVSDTALSDGVFVGVPFSPQDPRDEVQRFTVAFRQRYGIEPDGNAALAYDATRLVARAVSDGGASREGVRRWLASRTRDNAFPGVTGSIAFQSTGDVIGKGYVMTQVRRGALVVAGARGS